MKRLISIFFVLVFFTACKKEDAKVVTPPAEEKTLLNVAYGNDALQQMDIYLPAGRTTDSTKVLVLIHGGGWSGGDKSDFADYLAVFKQRLPGYAIFNINYRLASYPANNVFPTQENDVKAAVDTIISKAGEYLFNKEKLALLGASAGAHLALLQGYKYSTPKVKTVVDMFGPTDMADLYYKTTNAYLQLGIQILMGGTPTTNSASYQSASPINYVSAGSPATLILHGDADGVVPVTESQTLKEKLDSAKVPAQLVIYPGEGHGWTGTDLTDTYQKIEDFLKQYNP